MVNFSSLNAEQMQAVEKKEGPVLILAGAGSGKTRVIISRIIHLIESGIPPSKILAVTFTKKASEVMRNRIQEKTHAHVFISTFHSLGARILRESIEMLGYRRDFIIYDEEDVTKLLKICLDELHLSAKMEAKTFRYLISQAKNNCIHPENVDSSDFHTEEKLAFPRVYALYQKKLKEFQAVDFDDLLFLPLLLLKNYPEAASRYQHYWDYVLVDEYQDTNEAQYSILQLLTARHHNLFVVGDPDQSIYSWRGANIQNILNFEQDYPGAVVIRLEQNYRSRMNILQAANAVICNNTNRYEKELWSDLGAGKKIQLFKAFNDEKEAEFVISQIKKYCLEGISLRDMVVFYRTNAQSRILEDTLIMHGIPYLIVGGISFYQRREIKDILAFLRIAHLATDYVSFARTVNLPKRGIGETTLEKLRMNANEEGMTILEYVEAILNQKNMHTSIRLTTKQRQGLSDYIKIIREIQHASISMSIHELIKKIVHETGYLSYLAEDAETKTERKENIDELISKAIEWEKMALDPSLAAFLEELTLKSSSDDVDHTKDCLSVMTMHNGKGLEFDIVFLIGMEEDILPHINAKQGDSKAIEEERRLCYVAMTRAKEVLYLSYCTTRYQWGDFHYKDKSRFISEIPDRLLEEIKNGSMSSMPFSPRAKELVVGDRIFHKEFGIGQIQEAYEGTMGLTYKVLFEKNRSIKTIVAHLASLNRI